MTKLYSAVKKLGDILSDTIADFGGSWSYIAVFLFLSAIYMWFNTTKFAFDIFPYSFLNLGLGFAASLQAPFLLMAGNRSDLKKRKQAELDFQTDKDTNKRIKEIEKELKEIKELLRK